jgi:O-antigen ligase
MAIAKPSYGLDHIRGDAWRGVFTTKNELGRIAAFALGLWLLRGLTQRSHPVVALEVSALAAYVVVKSGSRTADVVVILILALLIALPALRAHFSIALPSGALFLAGLILVGNWLATHADAVLSSAGSDSTFTGRSKIWEAVWHSIQARPWFGYGYDAFWQGFSGASAQIWALVPSHPPHSHNGVLEVWLGLGVIGVFLLASAFALALWRSVVEVRRVWSFESVFPFLILVLLALYNVSEAALMGRNSLFWILLVSVSLQLTPQVALARDVALEAHPARELLPRGAM